MFTKLNDLIYTLDSPGGGVKVFNHCMLDNNIWIKTSLKANSSKDLYIYYDKYIDKDPFNDGSEIAFYKFDGNANDEYGNYNGTWNGNELYDKGVHDQSAKFDGGDRAIQFPKEVRNGLTSFTISLWFRCDNPSDTQLEGIYQECIYSSNTSPYNGVQIWNGYNNTNIVFRTKGGNETTIVTKPSDYKFHHIIITSDESGTYKAYWDGVFKSSINDSTNISNIQLIRLGTNFYDYTSQNLHGHIDNLRIFNRVLSDSEVQQLYELEKPNYGNGEEVFEFFDDFDGSELDSNKWVLDSSLQYSMSNSNVTIQNMRGAAANVGFNIEDGYVIETYCNVIQKDNNYSGCFGSPMSSRYTAASNGNSDATILFMSNDNSDNIYYYIGDGSTNSYNIGGGNCGSFNYNNYYLYKVIVDGGSVYLYQNDNLLHSETNINWSKNLRYIRIGFFNDYSSSTDIQDTKYDYILVRKYASSEPSISYGNEEEGNWTISGDTYNKRKLVTITNNSSDDLVDYQIRLDSNEITSIMLVVALPEESGSHNTLINKL